MKEYYVRGKRENGMVLGEERCITLLGCPFCGSEPCLNFSEPKALKIKEVTITCTKGCIEMNLGLIDRTYLELEQYAEEKWNTRV